MPSIHGRVLTIDPIDLNLESNGIDIVDPCVDASITVGAESSNVRAITIQLKKSDGSDVDKVTDVEVIMYTSSARTAFAATGGSTGIAIGTDGALLTVVTKKYFLATSEADGDIDLTWTDTGSESVALGLRLPTGRVITTSAFANSTA